MSFELTILEGKKVRLEPLSHAHGEGIAEAVKDGELWNLYVTLVPRPEKIEQFLHNAQQAHQAGDGLAFAIVDRATAKIAGSTRFMKADVTNQRLEIGFTFIGRSWQKTGINTETKLLMLAHAFETLKMNRVEIITDFLNDNSRRAILRLGAKEEGILRNHMVMPSGRIRDSVLYSIIRSEWPGVKEHLTYKIRQNGKNT